MVGSCRCLKENLDELRIERVCYERVTGYAEVIPVNPTAPLLPVCRQYGSYRVSDAAELISEGTQAMPSTPFVSRMGSSSFQSFKFRISMVPPWGQLK
jgi:hypothetical protein